MLLAGKAGPTMSNKSAPLLTTLSRVAIALGCSLERLAKSLKTFGLDRSNQQQLVPRLHNPQTQNIHLHTQTCNCERGNDGSDDCRQLPAPLQKSHSQSVPVPDGRRSLNAKASRDEDGPVWLLGSDLRRGIIRPYYGPHPPKDKESGGPQ